MDARAKEHLARFIAQRDILAARAVAEDRSGHSDVVTGESRTHINRRAGGEASGEDVERFPVDGRSDSIPGPGDVGPTSYSAHRDRAGGMPGLRCKRVASGIFRVA